VRRREGAASPLPDAVGNLGARSLERWVDATLVAVVLLGLLAAVFLFRLGAVGGPAAAGGAAASAAGSAVQAPPAPATAPHAAPGDRPQETP
jgi:hypothetical protein